MDTIEILSEIDCEDFCPKLNEIYIKKTADKTKYMREYKREQYKSNGELIKAKNKSYYFKRRYGLSTEDMKLYDTYLPLIAKIRKNLDELKEAKPDFIMKVLEEYLEQKLE
jgi:hypothetical protein